METALNDSSIKHPKRGQQLPCDLIKVHMPNFCRRELNLNKCGSTADAMYLVRARPVAMGVAIPTPG